MCEPYGRVLRMPWDEVLLAVADEREREDEDGAVRSLLQDLIQALARG